MRPGRYCLGLSRLFPSTASWSMFYLVRLASDLFRLDHAPSTCGCRKPVLPGQMAYGTRAVRSGARRRPGRSWLGRGWDDLRLVGLKLVFLVMSRVMSLL